jgi:hypothetical protein
VLLFPKSALLFEEEGWNCYPYTRTKYKHKLFTGFSIEMETQFSPDLGDNDNVFNLNKSELSQRIVGTFIYFNNIYLILIYLSFQNMLTLLTIQLQKRITKNKKIQNFLNLIKLVEDL